MSPIRPARADETERLVAIEAAAERLFTDLGLELPAGSVADHVAFVDACAEARLLVATDADDRAIGFARLSVVDGDAFIDEVDVDPDHGRRGHGSALVLASCAWARARGHAAIALTTWRDVPWNAPLYRRLGFVEHTDLGPELAAIRRAETARGLERQLPRCAMRRPV